MAHVFLSDSWFNEVSGLQRDLGKAGTPVLNLVVTDSPEGEQHVRVAGSHFLPGHADQASARITLPFTMAHAIFVQGKFEAAIAAIVEHKIKIDGDFGALSSISRSDGDELRDRLLPLTIAPTPGREVDGAAAARSNALAEAQRLGLEEHVRELDDNGLTIIPPEETGMDPGFIDRVREKVCDLIEAQSGARPDMKTGESHRNVFYPSLYYYLFEDRIFEELLMNEHALAMASYLCGDDCILSACTVFLKGPADPPAGGSKLQLLQLSL